MYSIYELLSDVLRFSSSTGLKDWRKVGKGFLLFGHKEQT